MVYNEVKMDRYNEMIRGKKIVATIFTLALFVGIGLIIAKFVTGMDILFMPGLVLSIVGVYVSSILWAVIQNDRILDEKIIKAVTVNNITSFNALNDVFNMNVDKLIHRVEYLAEKGCFSGYVYDRTYGMRVKGSDGKAVMPNTEQKEFVELGKRENMTQCSNCGASLFGANNECPYCGAKK